MLHASTDISLGILAQIRDMHCVIVIYHLLHENIYRGCLEGSILRTQNTVQSVDAGHEDPIEELACCCRALIFMCHVLPTRALWALNEAILSNMLIN